MKNLTIKQEQIAKEILEEIKSNGSFIVSEDNTDKDEVINILLDKEIIQWSSEYDDEIVGGTVESEDE